MTRAGIRRRSRQIAGDLESGGCKITQLQPDRRDQFIANRNVGHASERMEGCDLWEAQDVPKASSSGNLMDMDHFDELCEVTWLPGWCWGDLKLVSEKLLNAAACWGGVLKWNEGFHPSEDAGCEPARKSVSAGCNLLPVVVCGK